ncbi:MAG: 4-(cytidine 5'-diphospho)-2-C-methyl-D-erythritol kinase [Bacteroidaceae bacterium]|nr:4-(cytidine 5'-diphospho)-2-C-methyl-D-erythritol kinase [Bacteroidaceae bacterium]
MQVYPNAKLNIGLNIVERRPDGYHNIETIFYPIGLHDTIEMEFSEGSSETCSLEIDGNPIEGEIEDNLIVKAYHLLSKDFKLPSVSIRLDKRVPTGAGLGGGSADAAYTLRMLNESCQLCLTTEQLEDYAVRLGADCPFFIRNTPVFATGIGNVFTPVNLSLQGKYLVLVKPDVFVSTRDAYAAVKPQRPSISLPQLIGMPIEQWREKVVNDFEASVFPKFPEIKVIKDRLYDLGAVYASMSGSGSSVFGIFNEEPKLASDEFNGCFLHTEEL